MHTNTGEITSYRIHTETHSRYANRKEKGPTHPNPHRYPEAVALNKIFL